MEISIIIVNYNVRDFLESTLQSVRKALTGIAGEVFVVDNASQDGSVAMVREKFPDVKLIASPENLGFGRANNLALRVATGRYFLILNPDTLVQEDTFTTMIRFMDEHPDAGMAGCKVLNADGTFQLSCRRGFPTPWASFCKVFGLSTIFPASRLFAGYNLTYMPIDGTYVIDALAGSFMIVRRAVFEQTNGFDEDYFMYGEDLDWCYRTQKAGWKVYYTSQTQIVHYKGESTKRSSLDEVHVFYDAMHIFVRKNIPSPFFFILFLRVGIVLRSALAVLYKRRRAIAESLLDCVLVAAALIAATANRFGSPFGFPAYAYPTAIIVPVLIIVLLLAMFGVYGRRLHSIRHSALAVGASFFVISSLTFFFKEYAFSRQVVLEMSAINLVVLCVARYLLKSWASVKEYGEIRRTLIVGTSPASQDLLQRLRVGAVHNYYVAGFIDVTVEAIGKSIAGLPVLGSGVTIARVVEQYEITDVIFVSDAVPYAEMLLMMQRCVGKDIMFRLVPSNAEVLLAKSGIDVLAEFPLVALDLNILRPLNRIQKRVFDIALGVVLMIIVTPLAVFLPPLRKYLPELLDVVGGQKSFVGPHVHSSTSEINVGKPGLVSMGDVFASAGSGAEQQSHFDLYYARNQSLFLDLKILRLAISGSSVPPSSGM